MKTSEIDRNVTLAVCGMADKLLENVSSLTEALEATRAHLPNEAHPIIDDLVNHARRNTAAARLAIDAARYDGEPERLAS